MEIKNIITENLVNAIAKLTGINWYENIKVVTRRGVKIARLVFKSTNGAVYEATAKFSKVGDMFYNSIAINGLFFNL